MEATKHAFTELKSMASPPQAVKDVVNATLLLMGKGAKEASEWATCAKIVGSDWKSQVENYDPSKISAEARQKAKALLDAHDEESIKSKSRAAAELYKWAKEKVG